ITTNQLPCPQRRTSLLRHGGKSVVELMAVKDPLVTCPCNFCHSPVQFQKARVGEAINCSNCGMETVLFSPGSESPYAREKYNVEARNITWATKPLGGRNLVGEVINRSASYLDWVRIEFVLYDQTGTPVGHTADCLIEFPPGKVWNFSAPVSPRGV